ncbi:MAG: M48 family metalloprotease [Bacteriovoracaceae bacterium]|jgi:beta-barrel assembly-enhancing protease|nr:M48 family metalloprotease [Bacteriovoracaceae bacterium]
MKEKFTPKKIPEGINRTHESQVKDLAALAIFFGIMLLLALLLAFLLIFAINSKLKNFINYQEEVALGARYGHYLGGSKGNRDKNLETFITHLWNGMQDDSKYRDLDFQVRVVAEDYSNAFTLPGGIFLVTHKFLEESSSENELAFVLCHELGHFYHRHTFSNITQQLFIGISSWALNMEIKIEKLFQLIGLKFQRDHEIQSDGYALRCVNNNYGHVAGSKDFFRKIGKLKNSKLSKLTSFFSTHPPSMKRLEFLKKQSNKYGYNFVGEKIPLVVHELKQKYAVP